MGVDPGFEQNESQIAKTGREINRSADAYEMETGDIETAEQVRIDWLEEIRLCQGQDGHGR